MKSGELLIHITPLKRTSIVVHEGWMSADVCKTFTWDWRVQDGVYSRVSLHKGELGDVKYELPWSAALFYLYCLTLSVVLLAWSVLAWGRRQWSLAAWRWARQDVALSISQLQHRVLASRGLCSSLCVVWLSLQCWELCGCMVSVVKEYRKESKSTSVWLERFCIYAEIWSFAFMNLTFCI